MESRRIGAIVVLMSLLFSSYAWSEDLRFLEKFATAKDRRKVLKRLIPGTADYYYYHCLYFQSVGKLKQAAGMLKRWRDRLSCSSRCEEIERRQALLLYRKRPVEALETLRETLNLKFSHRRKEQVKPPAKSSRLSSRSISFKVQAQKLLQKSPNNLSGFKDVAIPLLVNEKHNALRRRALLRRLRWPDIPNLPKLIIDDLGARGSGGFGSLAIHRALLRKQLDACLKLKPKLRNQERFWQTYIRKLWPHSDADWRHRPKEFEAYLTRLWDYVKQMSPAHRSLKLHVLYHRLKHDLSQGRYDQARFLEYLRIPRDASYMRSAYLERVKSPSYRAKTSASYKPYTLLPPVGNDEPLIRHFLQHFLRKETSTQKYAPFLKEKVLKHLFAETKIMAGLGEPEKWASQLPLSRYKALKDKVVLRFAPTNKKFFKPTEVVKLRLALKNIPTLYIKVYEINKENIYRKHKREVRANIELDGLVANKERVLKRKLSPFLRVEREFTFPSLKKRGTYVIDFIGSGKSSRALIHKGRLRHVVRTGAAGHVFTVFDEQGNRAKDPSIWMANRKYTADKDGTITVPFTKQPGFKKIILASGRFVSLTGFHQKEETYRFSAGFYVDRESLLRRQKATVLVRAVLSLHGRQMPLRLLKDVELTITSMDRFGTKSVKKLQNFRLARARESSYTFRVPPDLSHIHFSLHAEIRNVTQAKTQDFDASKRFVVNQIDRSEKIATLHLRKARGRYALDLLDRTGKPRKYKRLYISLKHRAFQRIWSRQLTTNSRGRVFLGPLDDIERLIVNNPEGGIRSWWLKPDRHSMPRSLLRAKVGQTLKVPYMGRAKKATRREFALFSLRGDSFVQEHFDALRIKAGFVEIRGLAPGDYKLFWKRENRTIRIQVAQGKEVGPYLIAQRRSVERSTHQPLQIVSARASWGKLKLKLAHADPWTRVHVVATRYVPTFSLFDAIDQTSVADLASFVSDSQPAAYLEGREIGSEYRYILRRKNAKKYPGNMLKRPTLLLNPWEYQDTLTGGAGGLGMSGFGRGGGGYGGRGYGGKRAYVKMGRAILPNVSPNLDFLRQTSVVLINLKPDAKGHISIPQKKLRGLQHIRIVATNARDTVIRSLSLAERTPRFRDLRLRRGLDPKRHFIERKGTSLLRPGKPFQIKDITTAKFEVYDSLASVYKLLFTLKPNAHWKTFSFLLRWPKLSPSKKRTLYSKHACHELHFFLYKKDPAFFKAVVRPYLQNKKDKTFLDHWLLGAKLNKYLKPWAYQQLNIVERILLAQRIPGERKHTARHIRHLLALRSVRRHRLNFLFNTALQSNALDLGGRSDTFQNKRTKARITLELYGKNGKDDADDDKPTDKTTDKTTITPKISKDEAGRALKTPPAEDQKGGKALRQSLQSERSELRKRSQIRLYYRQTEKTKEWVENNYYKLPIHRQNASLVQVNAFWGDYASHTSGPFTSRHITLTTRNFTEMMFALSVLDLPFVAPRHAISYKASSMRMKPAARAIAFHKQLLQTKASQKKAPILVSQNFFRYRYRYHYVKGERRDRYVSGEFLTQTVYGCQVVVTNPTSSRQKLELLQQIPRGAISLRNGRKTHNIPFSLGAYQTRVFVFYFYFPAPGSYSQFPAHIAKNGRLVAFAKPATFKAVTKLSKVDKKSWEYISQHASLSRLLRYLQTHNVHRLNLTEIAWRMRSPGAFRAILALLRKRHLFNPTLWSYGFKHNDLRAMRTYLQHRSDFVRGCGLFLKSTLLNLDPVARKTVQHMEYSPLINARIHPYGTKGRIVNDRFRLQYRRFLRVLRYRPGLDNSDRMALVYYMLLQDRVTQALKLFAQVDPKRLKTQLQYDYFRTYLSFYKEDLKTARQLVAKYKNYPVVRWQKMFANVGAQLDEIDGKGVKVTDKKDRDQEQTKLAATEASFDFNVESRKVTLSFQHVKTFQVSYYLMDIELLFSRNPFVQQHKGQFAYIRPNLRQRIKAPKGRKMSFSLPKQFHNSNVIIEVAAAGLRKAKAYYANSLTVQIVENYGQLKVSHETSHKALSRVYIKVYARYKNGGVKFYKDGYTDLRGRFDYAALSTNDLDNVKRFSILILSEKHGAIVREAEPPKR